MSEPHALGEPDVPAVPREVLRSWNGAAEQLFGTAVSSPDIYQRVTTIVGRLVESFRDRASGVNDLLAACESPDEALPRLLGDGRPVSWRGLDSTALLGAACAMRYREVLEESAANVRKAALLAADPQSWVVLEESGPFDGDPYIAYRRIEAHPATGLVVMVSTRPDDTLTACVHAIDVMRLDPATGVFSRAVSDAALSSEHASAREREDRVIDLRQELLAAGE